jgi:ABC-type nitrate/sulfonate/bicarbonate transport system ATPase subunit
MMYVQDLTLSFGEKKVLDHFSLPLPTHGVTALSGPSGCGKTSLMRCIAGLEFPEQGIISGIAPHETAFLFQENRLLPWRTVEEHITDVLPPHRMGEVEYYLELAELTRERKQYPRQLSGGMARRLAFARCMALEAKLYLLDEPFTGIDLDRTQRLMDYLSALSAPVLLSTHEPEVLAMAQQVIRLDGLPLRILD